MIEVVVKRDGSEEPFVASKLNGGENGVVVTLGIL